MARVNNAPIGVGMRLQAMDYLAVESRIRIEHGQPCDIQLLVFTIA
jgi:hypothetical protein